MEELKKNFSPQAQKKLEELIAYAKGLDVEMPPHMLIYVNDEGFMEKAPGPSGFVKQWIKEFSNRKEFYSEEELLIWLKKERERELGHLKEEPKASFQKYFRLLLELIRVEIKSISTEETEADIADSVQASIVEGNLSKAMEALNSFLDGKDEYAELEMELIMHRARLTELQSSKRENIINSEEYLQEKAKLRKALLQMLILL